VKQAIIRAPGEALVREAPPPVRPADGYLVAVRACALCTWEQRVYRGATPQYPFAGGHEIGGVVAAGPDGGPLAPGTLVAVSRLPRCGRCAACERGLDNLCAYLTPFDAGEGPGGLAEYLVAAEGDLAALPDTRTAAEAALVEPLACVLNSLAVAGVDAGSRLAVVGNGFMGVLHARAAAARGAEVVVLETGAAPAGLERAWRGARRPLGEDALATQAPLPEGEAFDAAIVIRGAPWSIAAAAQLVRPGGVVSVYASLAADVSVGLPSRLIRRRQLVLTAAASHRRVDFARAAEHVADGTVAVADLVHRRYPLAQVQAALAYAAETDSGRVIVTLDGQAEPMER